VPIYTKDDLGLFTKKVAVVAAFLIVGALLWAVRDIVILVFVAAVLAAGIAPAVYRVRVWGRFFLHRNIQRGTAVMVVYLPFLALVVTILAFVVPQLISDWKELSVQLPVMVEKNILLPLEKYVSMEPVREALREGVPIERSSMFGYVRGAGKAIAAIIAVLFMIAYMLIDAHRLRNLILLVYPADVRGERRRTLNRIGNKMSSWLAGQLILAAIIGIATFVALLLLRIPYALPLAILAAVGEMVPVIGPILGAVPALAIAILASRWQFWSVLAFAVLLQKFENLFIAPRVMSKKVEVSPLAIIIAFMIGGTLLGIVGAIMAIPVVAILQVTFEEAFVLRRERRQDLDRAGTLLRRVD
jgi:predicted PurR-regulated permease PerM